MSEEAVLEGMRGRFDEARAIYNQIYTKGEGTFWRDRARLNLEAIDRYLNRSQNLLDAATNAMHPFNDV